MTVGALIGALRTWAAPISAMAVVCITLSLSVPLFALLLEGLGQPGWVIGLNHTMAAIAMVAAAPVLPLIMARTGIVPLMLGALIVLALAMMAIPLFESALWWGFLRVLWGFAATALFFASEFWVVTKAPEAVRGRVVGGYVLVLSGSYMIGPALLTQIGIDSWVSFAVPTAVILLALVPLIWGRHGAPRSEPEGPVDPLASLKLFRTDPLVTWGVVLFGVIEFGAMGLIAIWGVRTGFDQDEAVLLGFWLAFGSMAFQLPVGWAADRFDRRRILAVCGAVSIAAPLAMILWSGQSVPVAAAVFVWGGMAVAFYAVALTELGARYRGAAMADANAAVVLAYGIGALVSPTAFGWAMDLIDPHGVLWLAAAAAVAYLTLAIARIRQTAGQVVDSAADSGS